MLNMGLLVCCSLPYVIISTPIIYSTVKTWFAASHNSAGSRTDRYNCLPYYTAIRRFESYLPLHFSGHKQQQ